MAFLRKLLNFKKSFFHNHGKNNHVFLIDENGIIREIFRLPNSFIKFKGDNNIIKIYEPVSQLILNITVYNNTKIILYASQYPRNISISGFNNNGNTITIGHDFSSTDLVQISLMRGDGDITIGDDCMFAYKDIIQLGDGHAIYSKTTNKIINNNQNIIIGNHVWVGADVLILKGAKISDNSIVGVRSIVTKKFDQENTILAGSPAKIVKEDIYWTRKSQY